MAKGLLLQAPLTLLRVVVDPFVMPHAPLALTTGGGRTLAVASLLLVVIVVVVVVAAAVVFGAVRHRNCHLQYIMCKGMRGTID
jgi:hypothetical protein